MAKAYDRDLRLRVVAAAEVGARAVSKKTESGIHTRREC
jgi:hypothetical protein